MEIIKYKDISFRCKIIVIGNFDGVHLGHIKLIEFAKGFGDVSILTFTPHPKIVLDGIKRNFLLTLDEEKLEIFNKLGIDDIHFVRFTKEFSNFSPERFVDNVILKIKPEKVVVGYDFKFGKGRSSDAETLKQICMKKGINVEIFPEVLFQNEPVKSSKIRNSIIKGDFDNIERLLLRKYEFKGNVVKGEGIGKKIGFPTSNLEVDEMKLLPESGVFKVIVNDVYKGMLYIGSKPTLDKEGRFIEVHIFDFKGDLYGKTLRISFIEKLRDEIRFKSLEELKKQLIMDKEKALKR